MTPLITTIVPTYRRPELLKRAIQSILAQTYPNFQVYVCDNASQDETKEIVEEFSKKDGRIKYFCQEQNIGMIGNYQFGLSLVDTDFFSFLSDDDILLPVFYETAMQEFTKHPEAGFVAGSTIIMKPNKEVIVIPCAKWPREGKFEPPHGVAEMIGKYPVPTSIIFRKKVKDYATIDHDNILLWDPDYLIQIASHFPIVISKKLCAIFFSHPSSFSGNQTLALCEEAHAKLIKRIHTNPNLQPDKIEELILTDLNSARKFFMIENIIARNLDEASRIAKLIGNVPSFEKKSRLYLSMIKIFKVFPILTKSIEIRRYLLSLIRSFKNRAYKSLI